MSPVILYSSLPLRNSKQAVQGQQLPHAIISQLCLCRNSPCNTQEEAVDGGLELKSHMLLVQHVVQEACINCRLVLLQAAVLSGTGGQGKGEGCPGGSQEG